MELITFHYICIVNSCSLFGTVVLELINTQSTWHYDLRIKFMLSALFIGDDFFE